MTALRFLTEPEPMRGVPLAVAPGVWRVVAGNPGPMTYHGTNTYLIEDPEEDAVTVLDPGPDDPVHVEAVIAAARGRIRRVLLSHGHRDHTGALPRMCAAIRVPVFGWSPSINPDVAIDQALADGDRVGGLTALHTPGHAADHLCYASADGLLFTGDHVMSWSTSVVSPPHGDMAAYLMSLERLAARADRCYLPGHGPPLAQTDGFAQALLDHRKARENAVIAALETVPATVTDITARVYPGLDPRLQGAAERNMLAHLLKLAAEGRARKMEDAWQIA
ncbi:MAG TPA: MBL fold metallo-hydrolase [Acetobacteraceae bacterium]|jgi:glyoxylase-like metal-dependent hydrolase (beta-lactamase superfamily II)|nr:MBL fold metallo-hydrolase [Acetobacteraceae bacterium]